MKRILATGSLVLALVLSASVVRAQNNAASSDDLMMVAPAPPVQTIAPADVLQLIQNNDSNFVLVDAQPVEGYADTHIAGAMSFPWETGNKITKFPIALPRNKMLVIYTACPVDLADLVGQLTQYGYSNFKVVAGGLTKWQELKYPVVKGSDAAPASELQPASSQVTAPGTDTKTVAQVK